MSEAPSPRGRGRPKTLDRQRTIEIATDSYWREDLNDLSVNEMCRRAGIAKPGLYREFGGEDGLMAAALDHYRRSFIGPMFDFLAEDRPFAEALDGLVESFTSQRDTPEGCLLVKMRMAPGRLGPLTASRVKEVRAEFLSVLEERYRRALARDEGNPEIAPELAATYLDSQLLLIVQQMMLGESPESIRAQAVIAFRSLHGG